MIALTHVVELTVIPAPENDAARARTTDEAGAVDRDVQVRRARPPALVDVTVGLALTVNMPTEVTAPVSGFVTVRSRAPVAAFEAIDTFAVSFVALTKFVELTVMPAPENDATAPLMNFVPLIVMTAFVAP